MHGFCLDIESDGFLFESKNVWVIWFKDLNDPQKKLRVTPYKDKNCLFKIKEFVNTYSDKPLVVFHNGLGFDIFVLRCLLGVDFKVGKKHGDEFMGLPVQFVDTYYLSMFLWPDRPGHSIEYFGSKLGLPKIDFKQASIDAELIPANAPDGDEFKKPSDIMFDYCERDVDVNIKVFKYLFEQYQKFYPGGDLSEQHFRSGQKSFFLMSCQEYTGFKFDLKLALELKEKIATMMEEIRADVEPQLPPRRLKKSEESLYTMPAKPFKKDGSLSSNMLKFIDRHGGTLSDGGVIFFGKEYTIESNKLLDITMPMEMANQEQIKEYLLESGWKPTLWNFKRGPDGKPVRDTITKKPIPTSPKMQEMGRLCPNLEEMEGDLVRKIVKWLSLRNRQSILEGWLKHERLQYDGRLPARRSGIASSHRQRHAVICNIPKAADSVLLGKEFRSLFSTENGMFLAAGDAAALEGRVQGAYTWKYDNGKTAHTLLEADVHSQTVKSVYGHIKEIAETDIYSPDFDKEASYWKPYRNKCKNLLYGIMYGAGAAKAAALAGFAEKEGQKVIDKFWEANPGTKALKDAIERYWESKGQKKYLPAIDGRILHTRSPNSLLNLAFQSCGGIVMDYACCFMDSWLGDIYFDDLRRPYYLFNGVVVRRVEYYHDEMAFECGNEETAEIVSKMIEKSISKAGEFLKLKVPLAGEGKVGKNWMMVH